MCKFFHKWGKWEQYEQKMSTYVYKTKETFVTAENWQRRHCERCGKVQEVKI